jgi:hypothetical protein
MSAPLRLLVFDRTPSAGRPLVGAWRAGSVLYRALGRVDAAFGAATWDEALAWLGTHEASRPIAEVQYWGHGKWGSVLVDRAPLDAASLAPGHPHRAPLERLRERLAPGALVWLRTCEAFGARAGHDFARRLSDFVASREARVAGHTFVIGALQSGLHGLMPGAAPDWSEDEGLAEGTPEAPTRAHTSVPSAPRTLTCFDGEVPQDWFAAQ